MSTVINLLKNRHDFLTEIHHSEDLRKKIINLLITSVVCFGFYGAIIGGLGNNNYLQILSSTIKLPILYLVTLLVCLPTLYIFNAFFGSQKTLLQHCAYLLTAIAVIAVLLCGFAPVALFFLLTVNDRYFFIMLNICIFTLTGILGISFLYQIMKPIADDDSDQNVAIRTSILRFWLILYGFVGTQLGWTLRPFFGTGAYFDVFRPREGTFLGAVWKIIQNLLNF